MNLISIFGQDEFFDKHLKRFLNNVDLVTISSTCKILRKYFPKDMSRTDFISYLLHFGYYRLFKYFDFEVKWYEFEFFAYSEEDKITQKELILRAKQLYPMGSYIFCRQAAAHGNLELLKWEKENDFDFDRSTFAASAAYGHLNIMKWLKEINCPIYPEYQMDDGTSIQRRYDTYVSRCAAENGNLENLIWLRQNGCEMVAATFTKAIEFKHNHVIEWLKNIECPFDSNTFIAAAKRTNLEMLKWLKDNNCKYDSSTSFFVWDNQIVLQWLRENDYPLN